MDNQPQSNLPPTGTIINPGQPFVPQVPEPKLPGRKRKIIILLIAAILVIGIGAGTAVLLPKYQTASYAKSSKPLLDQLKAEIALVKEKTYNPELTSTDLEFVAKNYRDGLVQLQDSKKKIDGLRQQYEKLKNTKKTNAVNSEITDLFNTANQIISDNTKAIEERQTAVQVMQDTYAKRDEFNALLKTNKATFKQAAGKALEVKIAADVSISTLKDVRVSPDQKEYIDAIEYFLQAMSDGYGKESNALLKEDAAVYTAAQKEMEAKLTSTAENIKGIIANYYKNSEITKNFAKFETEAAKASSELKGL